MNGDGYVSYKCKECGLIFIIPLDGKRKASVLCRYLTCPLGHRRIEQLDIYEGLKECMEQTYSRLI